MPPDPEEGVSNGHLHVPGESRIGHSLLRRVDSEEPLEDVLPDVADAVGDLDDGALEALLTAIGRRYRRERAGGGLRPARPEGAG